MRYTESRTALRVLPDIADVIEQQDFSRSNTPWEEVLEAFLGAVSNSTATTRSYRLHCAKGCRAMGIRTLPEINGAMLAAYRGRVVQDPALASGTKAVRLAALRSFLTWSWTIGAHSLGERVIKMTLRSPHVATEFPYRLLSEAEVARLWGAATRPVDQALLAVTLGAGLRSSEVAHLRVQDCYVDPDGGPVIHVFQGKGNKNRTVPVQPEYFERIVGYLESSGRSLLSPGIVFMPQYPTRARTTDRPGLSAEAVLARMKTLLHGAGIDPARVGVHGIRHMYAIGVLRYSHDVMRVSKLLGHSNVAVTMRYVDHLELTELREALPPGLPLPQTQAYEQMSAGRRRIEMDGVWIPGQRWIPDEPGAEWLMKAEISTAEGQIEREQRRLSPRRAVLARWRARLETALGQLKELDGSGARMRA